MMAMTRIARWAVAAWIGLTASAVAQERINAFESHISVHPDGSMTVTETITVTAAGDRIKRGIYREFPTEYRDRFGNTVRIAFEVVEILRDGGPEPWHIRDASNGVRIYIGDADSLLKPGRYTYSITYGTARQLGFFDTFDELHWNVTGNGWDFRIDTARAVIELPPGAPVLESAGWTGPQGSREQSLTIGHDATGTVVATSTRPLEPGEGLTVAVSWPKGFVTAPAALDEVRWLLLDNRALVVALAGLLAVAAFYVFGWYRVGRDPAKGTIIPRFAPPEGYSPAAVRYVMRMGYSDKVFAAAIISMAVKGYLTIEETAGGDYRVERTGIGEDALSPGERSIANRLFLHDRSIAFVQENHQRIGSAIKALKKSLKSELAQHHFRLNRVWLVAGAAASLAVLGVVVAFAPDPFGAAFMCVWLSFWAYGCYRLARRVTRSWQGGQFGLAIAAALFAVPFFTALAYGFSLFGETMGMASVLALAALAVINLLFEDLLRAPTVMGRGVMDAIEGFKMYLQVAERDRLGVLHPPQRTPELFEKYLPYALALDVDHEWSEQFSDVLADAGTGPEAPYRPRWYRGRSVGRFDTGSGLSRLGGAMSGAISAAATPPGSSSGTGGFSGGGGSSGGGGGGGGGGGW